ncbi:hypothetical protein RUM43_015113 [Polyplax serrata]|uniref:Uncharacterized protein n=1 Tax=Polyplax serrata TaxID=468196 RepID=A0AAN8P3Q8_POLSC
MSQRQIWATEANVTDNECEKTLQSVFCEVMEKISSIGVKEWVELISRTQKEYNLKDHEVRLKAAWVLKGRARKSFNSGEELSMNRRLRADECRWRFYHEMLF